ncbi:MAG: FHA domain-containing protein [Thermoleophilia bacterium]
MIDIVLLILKVGILILLYLFIWQVVKTAVVSVRGAAAAPAPDVALPSGARPEAVFTPEERELRREERQSERTMAGDKLDFTPHIDPRLVVEASPLVPAGVIFPLEGWITVGRAPESDIVLDEEFVSGAHARLVPRGQFYYVEDLGSTNGTYVNERPVTEAQLRPDSRVRIGETIFRYEE